MELADPHTRNALISRIRIGLLCLCAALMSWACTEESRFYPSGQAALAFSSDTVRFDTVFANVGSTTAWLRIYNPQKQTVRIDSVFLRTRSASGFRISLDAYPGDSFHDFELAAGDSAFLFVELTAHPNAVQGPQRLEDAIVFDLGGCRQSVMLEAWVENANMLRGRTFDTDTVFTADCPVVVYDSLVVAPGAVLRVAPGARVHFHDGASLLIYGRIEARGTPQQPVCFRGDRLDMAFVDFPYEWYPGQWYAIYIGGESCDNVFENVRIRGAWYGLISDSATVDGRVAFRMENCEISNMVGSAIYAMASDFEVRHSVLANTGSYTVAQIGGRSLFLHCTIANYQNLMNRSEDEPALALVNCLGESDGSLIPYPLERAEFVNTVIYGTHKEEVGLGLLEDYAHNFFFRHCLLRTLTELPPEYSEAVTYNKSPGFVHVLGEDYRYDFRPDSGSILIGQADTAWTSLSPWDFEGNYRLDDGMSDIGAYEYQPTLLLFNEF